MREERAARALARLAHRGQKYGGDDYFEKHVMSVVSRVALDPNSEPNHVLVAYLHDAVEDTELTMLDLDAFGFPPPVLNAIEAISRQEGEAYFAYINRVAANPLAAFVKRHDLLENLSNNPAAGLRARYKKALAIIEAN